MNALRKYQDVTIIVPIQLAALNVFVKLQDFILEVISNLVMVSLAVEWYTVCTE